MKTALIGLVCLLSFAVEGKKVPSQATIPLDDSANDRIVGGSTASPGAFPYQVSLRVGGSHFCGGSIIDESWILTAAHCVNAVDTETVVVGTNHISAGGISYAVRGWIAHPDFDQNTLINDIALIKLVEPIEFNGRVRPIRLARGFTKAGAITVLSGWGKTQHPGNPATLLQFVRLAVIENAKCAQLLKSTNKIGDGQICTWNGVGTGACNGDSGGPLVSGNEQVGVVSWGIPCARGSPDVFTRVQKYISWIESAIANTQD